ncbi:MULTISPECIES: hypothetical protein [unclassified Pseudoalteromonas]|uniref:hypothetical protein n=1 Tax=unclassified Pseudoalteromonas TaxID=194690 RepID=UPI0004656C95|nr:MULTISPECIES: hypothetical protein [unclassified Pseudoalteromonas]
MHGVEELLNFDFTCFQIEIINYDYDAAEIELILQHELGVLSKKIIFKKVRRFLTEHPSYDIDSPFLIDSVEVDRLTNRGEDFLATHGYGHLDKEGNILVFSGDEGFLYRIRVSGDINLDIVFQFVQVTS